MFKKNIFNEFFYIRIKNFLIFWQHQAQNIQNAFMRQYFYQLKYKYF